MGRHYEARLEPLDAVLVEVPLSAPLPLAPGPRPEGMAHLEAGRSAESEAVFRRLLLLDPSHAAALCERGRTEEARRAMRRSVELLPHHAQWLGNLALTEEAPGDADEAAKLRERAAEPESGKDASTTAEDAMGVRGIAQAAEEST